MKLSIIVPVYNEEKTIRQVLQKILKKDFGLNKEVIVVNDGSKDKTGEVLKRIKAKDLIVISYPENRGKGYALRKGFEKARGNILAIQDADLEYDLKDLKKLVDILMNKNLKVIYGSRFLKKNKNYKINSFYIANRILSWITSILYLRKVTDMETCYKVFGKEVLNGLNLKCNRFDIEPEITAKIINKGYGIKEIPIDYKPRTAKQGKKIKWKDGFMAVWVLLRERFSR
jgi:glycosyltransferase involved in cell wall biosynthesis